MANAAMALALAVIALGCASACAADGKPPEPAPPSPPGTPEPAPPPSPTPSPMPSTVTVTAPASELPLPAFSSLPSALALTVDAIDNPAEQPCSLRVWMHEPPPSQRSAELGGFAPYPASTPGTFVLRLPEEARQLLERTQGLATITVALEPIDSARPLREPLRVTLGARAWQ